MLVLKPIPKPILLPAPILLLLLLPILGDNIKLVLLLFLYIF